MPSSGKAAFLVFLAGSDHPEIYRGQMSLECHSIPESKIFRLPVIFTYVSLITTGDGIIQLSGDRAGRSIPEALKILDAGNVFINKGPRLLVRSMWKSLKRSV
jgi:hypothetical protein